nr:iron chelate uptake ABC transporter family permease subunit [Marinomonas mediterranea]
MLFLLLWVSLFSFSAFSLSPRLSLIALLPSHFVDDATLSDIGFRIVSDIRLPRALVAALSGSALAAAGVIMQGITNNPLASPSVLGINAGAALGMAFVSTLAPWMGLFGTNTAALMGGGIVWAVVMLLGSSWRSGSDHSKLVLAGVAISALCAALTKAMVILEEDQATGVFIWLAGSFADARWPAWFHLWPWVLCGSIGAILISAKLNVLQLGDDYAINLGMSPTRYKIVGSVLVLVLVASVVSTAGSLGFVGLLVPHMARLLVGIDHRKLMPLSMLIGACLVVGADILSRAIVFPMETPAGALLALIGAPFFIYLVKRSS